MRTNVYQVDRGYCSNGLHLADKDDSTEQHLINADGGYNPKCGWCWLNAGHTEAAHALKLADAAS